MTFETFDQSDGETWPDWKDLTTYRVSFSDKLNFLRKSQFFPKFSENIFWTFCWRKKLQTLLNRNDFSDLLLACEDRCVRSQSGPWNGFIFITYSFVNTLELMHPRLESQQGSARHLQSLWKSYTTENISFWYRNHDFLYKRMPLGENLHNVIDCS